MIEQALYRRLVAYPAITSLVGPAPYRIYPQQARQGVSLPYVTYFRVSTNRLHHLGGPSGLTGPRIQVDCWGATYESAKRLADQVRLALDGWRGVEAGLFLQYVEVGEDQDSFEEPAHAEEVGTHRVSMDVLIFFDEVTSREFP